jgi:hypothetical protein
MVITHLKSTHFSLPFFIKKFEAKSVAWKATFTPESTYNVDVDQTDWNKLCGVKWNYFQPRENAIMCGWRYNIEQQLFELTAYYHKNKSVDTSVTPLIAVPIGKEVTIQLNFKPETKSVEFVTFVDENDKRIVRLDWDLFDDGYYINSWFGGNRTPNKNVKFDLVYL